MRNRILRTTALTILDMAALLHGDGGSAWSQALSTPPATPADLSSKKIEGELVKIEGRYYIVKDANGKEVRLVISQDTELARVY
jgi:hypothetical protein